MGVRLYRVLLDEELDTLIEGRRHRGWLFTQQHFHRVVGGQAHDVLGADRMGAAFTVRAVDHSICKVIKEVMLAMLTKGHSSLPSLNGATRPRLETRRQS